MLLGELPLEMEKYRWLLENQYELAKTYNERKTKYCLDKSREEKRRFKQSKVDSRK